jgi:alpha-D-xyloside xylohydrolase
MGVDCFKSDFGERIPTDVVYFDGSDPDDMHNYYTYLYNKTVFDLLRKRRGERDAVVFARSATVGTQQFPVHWGGDNLSTPQSMAESLRGGLSLTMSGFGYWSHDIGGFEGTPEAWLFKRWIAFGLLSSHSRLHANYSYRVPWAFDEEAVDVLRRFTKLKATLMPYLYQTARTAHLEGVPMMRAMVVEFPDDPACTHLDRQYMLGPDLLVAPVFREDGVVDYYVPDGEWTHYLTGETVSGPRWVRETHGVDSVPLLVRPGAVLPVGAVDDRPDYEYADGVTLHVFGLADGASVTTVVPTVSGDVAATFTTTRRGDTVEVSADTPPARWRARVAGAEPVDAEGSSLTVPL